MSRTAAAFTDLAEWAEGSSPLYAALCPIVADDEDLLALADHVPDDRSTANVFLAAVHHLLRQGADHPLADYYPSVVEDPRAPDDDLAATLRDFCEGHADELLPLLNTRRTQTNAVRRCVALYPAFCHIAEHVDGPLALVELGPSAGLNLLWDRYGYDYGDGRIVGATDSPVTLRTEVRGDTHPPAASDQPAVHSRVGVDLNPLDLADADVEWLHALTWPEQQARREALSGAIELVRGDQPRLVEGDMLEKLPDLLAEIPEDVPVVVYSTLVLYQVPEAVREDLADVLEERMVERPLHWLSGDGIYGDSEGITLEWTREVEGEPRTDLLAGFDQHGDWVRWRPPTDAGGDEGRSDW